MTTEDGAPVVQVDGTAMVLPEDNVDTDQIIPSKYLKLLTFDNIDQHVFEGARSIARGAGETHPFDDPARRTARILLTGANFGCGSSREHAPQALYRWGVRAVAGISYGEIFQGNAATIGLPCVAMEPEDSLRARALASDDPTLTFALDLNTLRLTAGDESWPVRINESLRQRFITGTWDTLTTLSQAADLVSARAAALPYLAGFGQC
jgi:3-isopropylmalate/(R)-2-methylmalate dehydratase small subunit